MKKCVLADRICNDCGACDDRCQLDPTKICDNCFKCLDLPDQEYVEIPVSGVYLEEEYLDDAVSGGSARQLRCKTLYGCNGKYTSRI